MIISPWQGRSLLPVITQTYPQARQRAEVTVQPGLRPILCDRQVHPSIAVVIAQRRAALFAINFNTALLPRNRLKIAASIAAQPERPAGVVARSLGRYRKK